MNFQLMIINISGVKKIIKDYCKYNSVIIEDNERQNIVDSMKKDNVIFKRHTKFFIAKWRQKIWNSGLMNYYQYSDHLNSMNNNEWKLLVFTQYKTQILGQTTFLGSVRSDLDGDDPSCQLLSSKPPIFPPIRSKRSNSWFPHITVLWNRLPRAYFPLH